MPIFNLANDNEMERASDYLVSLALQEKVVVIELKKEGQRTLRQNAALHLMFTQLAQQLNDSGLYMETVLKEDAQVPWSTEAVKEYMWKPVQKAQLNKTSTTQLTTKEIDQVFDTLLKYLGENFNIELEFPSIETVINNQRVQEG